MADMTDSETKDQASRGLPGGTVTFVLTDVEGSTRLWEEARDAMSKALERHDELVAKCISSFGGRQIRARSEGDSTFSVFSDAGDAVAAGLALQLALLRQEWQTPIPIRARMAIHTGEAGLEGREYFGPAITRAARLRAIAHGGQIVISHPTRESIAGRIPEGAEILDLGSHRLKDLSTPERVYQLNHPDLPTTFAPLKSLENQPNNLPLQLTAFIGRESEMAAGEEILSSARLLTLTGRKEVGKSRLALQLAANMLDDYPDGVWLVDLASVEDSDAIGRAAASVIGVRSSEEGDRAADERRTRWVERHLIDYLKPFRLLVVFDNCEAMTAECAALVTPILRACPGVKVIATGEMLLGIDGEVGFEVPPLPFTDPALPCSREELSHYDSFRLFVDRAKLARPEFEASDRDVQAIAKICSLVEGVPGHVEAAAEWVRVLTCDQIAERLLADRSRILSRRR